MEDENYVDIIREGTYVCKNRFAPTLYIIYESAISRQSRRVRGGKSESLNFEK